MEKQFLPSSADTIILRSSLQSVIKDIKGRFCLRVFVGFRSRANMIFLSPSSLVVVVVVVLLLLLVCSNYGKTRIKYSGST